MVERPVHDVVVRTFLIADVRGYTAYAQARGDEAAARLASEFAEIVREGVEAYGGEVLELRGDEALAVFGSPRNALSASVALQQAFVREVRLRPDPPLLVGMGLDAGEAVAVEGGYRGSALNLAARLCASARPAGVVLASDGVVHLAGAVPGLRFDQADALDLKGLDRPIIPFSVLPSDGDAPADTLAALAERGEDAVSVEPGPSLPEALDASQQLFGRSGEARRLRWAWRTQQPVVIVGAPGMGKTRLAAELATSAQRDGAHVEYVPLGTPGASLVPHLVADDVFRLVVADDLDRASQEDLRAALAHATSRPLLAVTIADDGARPEVADLVRAADADGRLIRLPPLRADAVRDVAASYGLSATDVPVERILADSGGDPVLLQRLVAERVREIATRRLAVSVSRTAAGWTELRDSEARLAQDVVDLQLARERLDTSVDDPVCPYMGLASFDVGDAERFFGRERLVAELVTRLARGTLLGVVGPSGSGKSSAVRAGLVPTIAAGVLPGSESWMRAVVRPGAYPLRELDRAVWAAIPDRHRDVLDGVELPLRALRTVLGENERLLLVVDQFEETYTVCADQAERDAFVRALVEAAHDEDGRISVVLAVRADFYGRCAADPDLAVLLGSNHVLVGPMTAEEYRRAIELPAKRTGLRIDRSLVDALVADVGDEPGALPLLSTALVELWQRREGTTIAMRAYLETGGVSGAVARLAEETYAGLTERQRDVARSLMLRLTGSGEGDSVVRRRAPLSEFDMSDDDVGHVLDVLTADRLITVSEGSVEVAHEALLREWPRLRNWVDDDREGRRLREHLISSAREWDAEGRDSAELYRGARLGAALDWTTDHTLELNELERSFLAESRAAADAEADRQRRTNRRLRMLLTGAAGLLAISVVAGAAALVARNDAEESATAATAQRLGSQALVEKDLDRSLLLAREGTALDASVETYGNLQAALSRSPAALFVRRPTPGRPQGLTSDPTGRLVAVADNSGVVAVLNARTADTQYQVGGFYGLFAPDGTTLLTFDSSGLTFFQARTGKKIRAMPWPTGMEAFSPSPDLATLLTLEQRGTRVVAWDITGSKPRREAIVSMPADRPALDLNFLPNGKQYVTINHKGPIPPDGPKELANLYWTVGKAVPDWEYDGNLATGGPIAVAPDSETAVVVDGRGGIELLDLPTGERRRLHGTPGSEVYHAAFSDDGALLATGGETSDPEVLVWDARGGDLLETFEGHSGGVHGLDFLPDGRALYTSSLDGSVMAWDLDGRRTLFGRAFDAGTGMPGFHEPFAQEPALATSPDGRWLAFSQDNGKVAVRRARDGRIEAQIAVGDGPVGGLAFSPDGGLLAVGGSNGRVVVIDTSDWRAVGPSLPAVGRSPSATTSVPGVAFSADGKRLAAAVSIARPMDGMDAPNYDGRAVVWDVETRKGVGSGIELPGPATDVAFSADGRSLAVTYGVLGDDSRPESKTLGAFARVVAVDSGKIETHAVVDEKASTVLAVGMLPDGSLIAAGASGDLLFFDRSGGLTGRVKVSAGWVLDLEVAPDGGTVVAAGTDGTVRVVDAARRVQLGAPLQAEDGWVNAVRSTDGGTLFAAYQSGRGASWNMRHQAWDEHACSVAGRNLTREEWATFLPGYSYAPSCPFPDPQGDAGS